ncbi:MAG: aldehyde ferredoxin oxidoreductase N-terminal domain-containing protein [Chloroflexota bacterium]|nr:aldehyde ferredoxin oxidoreductase N-terminal domain-containing protein [Chloroflexota bacterium]
MTAQYGYTGKTLRVDLTSGHIAAIPTMDYADRFVGGMGIATKVYWDEVRPDVGALEPGNSLIFVTGPMAGFTGVAGSIWQVHCKSPLTIPQQFSYGSLAGTWGAHLKFAGYDAIVVQGRSERPVYLFIEDGTVEIRDASDLWGRGAVETREMLKRKLGRSARVATMGPAGENMVVFANVIADDDSSASGGGGAVMGSKNLKAVVVRGRGRPAAADPQRLKALARRLRRLKEGASQGDFGFVPGPNMKKEACYGCISGCIRAVMEAENGTRGKYMCESGIFYQYRARRYYGEWNEVPFYANRLCDDYGLDTRVTEAMLAWLTRCHKAGILTDANTGLPLSKLGSLEFIEALLKKTSLRQGFGDVLARGLIPAADEVGSDARALITDYIFHTTGQAAEGDPRMDIVTGLLYAMQPRQHAVVSELAQLLGKWVQWEKGAEGAYLSTHTLQAIAARLFGDARAVDFSTCEGKGRVAKTVQDRWSARESLITCAFAWPIADVVWSEDHMGDPSLESQVFSAATGREVDEAELDRMGEVVFNLRRAVFAREGRRGRQSDAIPQVFYERPFKDRINPEDLCLVPGKDGEPMSRKGAVVDRDEFETVKDEYYQSRGWDVATGLQTKGKLIDLGLQDIVKDLEERELVV